MVGARVQVIIDRLAVAWSKKAGRKWVEEVAKVRRRGDGTRDVTNTGGIIDGQGLSLSSR